MGRVPFRAEAYSLYVAAREGAEDEGGLSFRGLYFTGDYLLLQPRRNANDRWARLPMWHESPATTSPQLLGLPLAARLTSPLVGERGGGATAPAIAS